MKPIFYDEADLMIEQDAEGYYLLKSFTEGMDNMQTYGAFEFLEDAKRMAQIEIAEKD